MIAVARCPRLSAVCIGRLTRPARSILRSINCEPRTSMRCLTVANCRATAMHATSTSIASIMTKARAIVPSDIARACAVGAQSIYYMW